MEKYQVNIELSSIKKNKDAGQTTTVIPGRKTVSFEAYQLPEYFKHEENCIIYEWTEIDGIKKDFKGVIISEDLIQKCIEEKPNVNISFDFEHQHINHFPIPEYSYDYENTKVNCNNCGKEIFTKDLKADEFWDGENEYYSNEICPECGALDCCDLIYESIEDALKRAGKN